MEGKIFVDRGTYAADERYMEHEMWIGIGVGEDKELDYWFSSLDETNIHIAKKIQIRFSFNSPSSSKIVLG